MSHKHPHVLHNEWDAVIGLEIHVELNTKSKLFSVAPNHFGDDPNTNITEVCTGQPGSLPVLNREAVRKAVLFGCAIQGKVATFSTFDRKSYFYPDSPRNFQITQYENPIIKGGTVTAEVNDVEMPFAVNRVHLEDDAGMLKHFPGYAGIDYNRAGAPLIEIVSEPCIHRPEEAVAYAMAVKAILEYLDVSDCNMEEGSFRMDVNVSVRPKGENRLRNKIEIKNLNSFNFMELALKSEIHRQIEAYIYGSHLAVDEVIVPSTYRWDPDREETVLMRKKETADDYRYFPEPDLVPIVLTEAYIDEMLQSLPELPLQRKNRYVKQLSLTEHQSYALTSDKAVADYFEEAMKVCSNGRSLANWILVEFAARAKDRSEGVVALNIPPAYVGSLVNMIDKGTITGKIAKSVADEMAASPDKDPAAIVAANPDYQPLNDVAEIEGYVTEVIQANTQSVQDYKAGREKALASLVGQVMKLSKGKASPQLVNDLLKTMIDKMS